MPAGWILRAATCIRAVQRISINVTAAICMKCKCEHFQGWCVICIHTSLSMWMYLGNEGLGSGGTHEQHSTSQCVPVAMQLFHPHGAEHSSDHHVNIGFHLLERHIHPLLRRLVQEVLNAPDIWTITTTTDNVIQTTFIFIWPGLKSVSELSLNCLFTKESTKY